MCTRTRCAHASLIVSHTTSHPSSKSHVLKRGRRYVGEHTLSQAPAVFPRTQMHAREHTQAGGRRNRKPYMAALLSRQRVFAITDPITNFSVIWWLKKQFLFRHNNGGHDNFSTSTVTFATTDENGLSVHLIIIS